MSNATVNGEAASTQDSSLRCGWDAFLAAECGGPESTSGASGAAELQAVQDGCIVCDLREPGLIEATGADAEAFLHGQLSSDLGSLSAHRSQLSTYNSPKGRVLATLLAWRAPEGFLLQLDSSIAASVCKRLGMFVLRAKAKLALAGDRFVRLGVAGTRARETLLSAGFEAPEADFDLTPIGGAAGAPRDQTLRLPGERYLLVFSSLAPAIAAWRQLREAGAQPGTGLAWHWLTVRSGIAEIVAATQDQFVAQMLNYDLLGGVSFTKGCYPGQEIVARTQYRGEIKRRTLLFHTPAELAPTPGQALHAVQGPDQAVGTVLDAAAAPDGGFDLLACVHLDLAAAGELRLGAADGARLEQLALPYALPAR